MSQSTLEQVQQLVDQLSSAEQLQLLVYRLRVWSEMSSQDLGEMPSAENPDDAWRELFSLGDRLAATDAPDGDPDFRGADDAAVSWLHGRRQRLGEWI